MSRNTTAAPSVTVEKVVVEEPLDHAALDEKRRKEAATAREAGVRAGYVSGLQNELDYLERTPNPNPKRVADVKAQLAQYSEKPARAQREAAVPDGAPKPPEATKPPEVVSNGGPSDDAKAAEAAKAPVKKAVAKKAPVKKAAVKKTAAAK